MATSSPGQTPELVIDGRVATITLRRPEVANRLELEDLAMLRSQIGQVNACSDVLVLRLRSQGRHFCSGFNIGSIGAGVKSAGKGFEVLAAELEQARPVTIAALQGGIYGGATDLALACDFRIGTPSCELLVPAARLGLLFYPGGLERAIARLGLGVAKRIFVAAEKLDAAEMLAVGYLDRLVVSVDALMPAVEQLSANLTDVAPLAMLGMKKHLNSIASSKLDADAIARDIAVADTSQDLLEGSLAWREKRKPVFQGC